MSQVEHFPKLKPIDLIYGFKTTIIFVVLYFSVNLSLFTIFGQSYFHDPWFLFLAAPIHFGENFTNGLPTTLHQALFTGILEGPNFLVPVMIIFVAELGEILYKTRFPVFKSYVLTMVASWIFSPVGLFLSSTGYQPIKGTSIGAFCLLIYYWFAKGPSLFIDNRIKKLEISKFFILWFSLFWTPTVIVGLLYVEPGYIGNLDHYIGIAIFSGLFAVWYFWQRPKHRKNLIKEQTQEK